MPVIGVVEKHASSSSFTPGVLFWDGIQLRKAMKSQIVFGKIETDRKL